MFIRRRNCRETINIFKKSHFASTWHKNFTKKIVAVLNAHGSICRLRTQHSEELFSFSPAYHKLTYLLTELSPSWGAANCAAPREPPSILWNPKAQYRVDKALHRSLSWAISIQSTPSYPISLRSILILTTHLRLGLPSGLFPSGFPTNILYAFFFYPNSCYMPRPFHPSRLDYSNYTWRRVQVMKLLIMQFSPTSRLFIPFWSK
jgi:hypothetical protein